MFNIVDVNHDCRISKEDDPNGDNIIDEKDRDHFIERGIVGNEACEKYPIPR